MNVVLVLVEVSSRQNIVWDLIQRANPEIYFNLPLSLHALILEWPNSFWKLLENVAYMIHL